MRARTVLEPADIPRRTAQAMAVFSVQLIWFSILFTGIVSKLLIDGFVSYTSHFTNWALTSQMLFYGITCGASFVWTGLAPLDGPVSRVTQAAIVLFFFPLSGIAFTVMIVVATLFLTGSTFLTKILLEFPVGVVFFGNEVVHFVPVAIFAIFAFLQRKLIYFSLNRALVDNGITRSPVRLFFFIAYQAFAGSAILLGIYTTIFDPRVIYDTELPFLSGIVVAFLALLFCNAAPLMYVLLIEGVGNPLPYTAAWLWRNDADPRLTGGVLIEEDKNTR